MRRAQDASSGAAVFEAVGDNDTFDADRLQQELDAVSHDTDGVVVDLTKATFVDSTFVGVLLVQSKVREQRLAVIVPPDETNAVRRMFTIAHLTEVLPVYETRDAGLAAVAGGG